MEAGHGLVSKRAPARVVELVDTGDLKSSVREYVRVRVPPWAHNAHNRDRESPDLSSDQAGPYRAAALPLLPALSRSADG